MSSAIFSLLERQHEQPWRDAPLLIINPLDDALATLKNAEAWCFHAGTASQWQAKGSIAYCQASAPDISQYTQVMLVVAKEKALNHYILEQLTALPTDAIVWLVGEKRSGVQSLAKKLPESFSKARKVASGNHCQLFSSSHIKAATDPRPLTDYATHVHYELNGHTESFTTLPGVFSQTHIDPATLLLLNTLSEKPLGQVLDFACGAGVITSALRQSAEHLTACDVNPMAIAASTMTFAQQGIEVDLRLADGLPDNLGVYDTIVSNPPFHTGQKTDYTIARKFLSSARKHLKKNGALYIVANRFLPWPEVIEEHFGHCETLVDDGRYRVYEAIRR
ncbi:class I SAM-dependent methyltransferase [Idiomarina piscisalsi]|uniref:Class I SAM-dependent methyltransferase n=1 Tax=Idiomarina piscisalsi TaxID=1096243 RepID=A0A432YU19_9GAMM|nr:class I SAM-dependent methyltransferase [Idiomarina piscisalsi]RUO66814.1 class I SAM-dependent methyltransferase [Idiomarina piscisalsi]